jgi:nitroreductase
MAKLMDYNSLKELFIHSRSYRRFKEDHHIPENILTDLISLARFSPSPLNLQPLKYILINEEQKRKLVFPTLLWAGYLKNWPGPAKGERPSAYIIMLGDKRIKENFDNDAGIACQSILLGAVSYGLGGCTIGSVNRKKLRNAFSIPVEYSILLVIALGLPAEKVVLEETVRGQIKYYRDKKNVHHVPKRPLKELILKL